MLNTLIPHLPNRPAQPRNEGLTMMMDKGLSLREVEDFCDNCNEYCDLVKFGFGTSIISKHLEKKIQAYKNAGLKPYFGGTLFEVFIIRGMFDEYRKMISKYKIEIVEVSDGSMEMKSEDKLKYIELLAKEFTVLSEVGSKQAGKIIPVKDWVTMTKNELNAGAWKVIAEARESGNTGIYNTDGSANKLLIDAIAKDIDPNKILWEAPIKSQQIYFIKQYGANVNLGNIASNEIIPLETLRLGLRGDTFFDYLPK